MSNESLIEMSRLFTGTDFEKSMLQLLRQRDILDKQYKKLSYLLITADDADMANRFLVSARACFSAMKATDIAISYFSKKDEETGGELSFDTVESMNGSVQGLIDAVTPPSILNVSTK